jgi:hypothetical protein
LWFDAVLAFHVASQVGKRAIALGADATSNALELTQGFVFRLRFFIALVLCPNHVALGATQFVLGRLKLPAKPLGFRFDVALLMAVGAVKTFTVIASGIYNVVRQKEKYSTL